MKLLLITPDRERAQDLFCSLEQLEVDIEYSEVKQADWLAELPEVLVEKTGYCVKTALNKDTDMGGVRDSQGQVDAVLLYTEREGSLAEEVRCARGFLPVPLLVCSERAGYFQEMQCLQAGADDYQGTDCRAVIWKLRIQRLIQIYQGRLAGMFVYGGLLEDPEERQFYYGQTCLGLTVREYQVLHWLVHSREAIVPRGKLLYHIWGKETAQTSRALDTVVKQLRKKLSGIPVSVHTCYGRGYRLEKRME